MLNGERRLHPGHDQPACLDDWLASRQSLIIQYCSLCAMHDRELGTRTTRRQRLELFCQTLMAYLSAADLELFHQLLNARKAADQIEPGDILPRIAASTEQLLLLHDQQLAATEPASSAELVQILSQLGEVLAARLELEDVLLRSSLEAVSL